MDRPKGLEGKKYATWDLPVEKATIKDVMEADGGDFDKVELIPSTVTDEVTALRTKSVDAIWIFMHGPESRQSWKVWRLTTLRLRTWILYLILYAGYHSQQYIPRRGAGDSQGISGRGQQGYEFAIEHPQEAGEILCKAAPELDPDLVKASQEYLADKYQADAPQWGYIDQERWDAYYAWLNEKGLTETPIEAGTGCSNEYLP